MTIDFWGLGLQAINVVILVWLLTRVFWRPVAAAIAKRHEAAQAILGDAAATKTKADAALAELSEARDGIASERTRVLAQATASAEAAKAAALAEAKTQAAALMTSARATIAHETDAVRAKRVAQSGALAVEIAQKLLGRLPDEAIQVRFLDLLVEAIAALPASDRAALAKTKGGLDLLSPADLSASAKVKITKAVQQALEAVPELNFVTDPDLIAGFELRSAHFVLRNSWQADLAAILKELQHVA